MNKRQIEVQKISADAEKEIIRQLKLIYVQAAEDCELKIQQLSMRADMENLQSIVWQKQYQEVLKKQIDGILNELDSNSFTTIADYLGKCYETGFFGTMYDLQGQGIPLIFPINQEQVVQALQIDSKISQGLYRRMGEDIDQLKESIRVELSRGISNGSSWNTVAKEIASGMNSPFTKAYNRAIGIARTEGHRVQQESGWHCQQKAKAKGADVVKQWDSTLDGDTRPDHVELNGQIREVDEPFEVAGKKAMYPGAFGDPSKDCNCRCCLLQRARWAITEEEYYTKWNGDKNELVKIPAKSYNEFKVNVAQAIKNQASSVACQDYSELEKYLSTTYGVTIDDSVKVLNFESVREGIEGIERVLNEFPQAKSRFTKVSTGNNGIMSASYKGRIDFNPSYYMTRANAVAASQSTGFHPKGNNVISTGAHEAGHLLETALIEKRSPNADLTGLIEWTNCTQAKVVVSQACKNAKKLPDGKGLRNVELKGGISGYAKKDDSECLAEAVSDYILNGENAAPLSRCIWDILKNELG